MNNQNFNDDASTSRTSDTTQSSGQKESLTDRVGDVIEKAGHIISDAGAPVLGQKIHDLGDKLESHHSNSEHPHKA